MRKRWQFNPRPWIALWSIGGFITMFVVAAFSDGCNRDGCGINGPWVTADTIEVSIWLGPFVLYGLGYLVAVVVPAMTKALWEARPRRIEEPVIEDLREIHPPPS